MQAERQRFIGCMIMRVLNLYPVPLSPADIIAARMAYLCEQYKIPKRADGSTVRVLSR